MSQPPGTRRPALVTGGGAGIGAAFCVELARHGWPVYVTDRDLPAAEAVADRIVADGGCAWALACDVADDDSIARTIATVGARHAALEVLVNNAGVFPSPALAELTGPLVDQVVRINLAAPIVLTAAARPLLAAAGRSHVVFLTAGAAHMSSITTDLGRRYSLYGATKSAVERWAFGVATEASADGIHVLVVEPGAVIATPGTAHIGLAPGATSADDVARVSVAAILAAGERPEMRRLHVASGEELVGAAAPASVADRLPTERTSLA